MTDARFQPATRDTAGPPRSDGGGSGLVRAGGPLGISVGVHVLALLALTWITWDVRQRDAGTGVEVGLVLEHEPPEGLRWPVEDPLQTDEEPILPADVDPFAHSPAAALDALASEPLPELGADAGGGFGLADAGAADLLGIGGGSRAVTGGLGSGLGLGQGVNEAGVWNLRAKGQRFAYVVDFSGSIVVAVGELKRELKRSIGRLTAGQLFNVYVFFSEGDTHSERFRTESFAAGLVAASTEHKRAFFDWIDAREPRGSTEPLSAMKRALGAGPDAVFFFSDGYFEDQVVEQIVQENRRAGAQVHCLVFDELLLQDFSDLPRMTLGARRMQRVAELTNGQAKVVTGADLQR